MARKPSPPPDADAVRLFREAVGRVRPLPRELAAAAPRPRPPAPRARMREADEAAVAGELLTHAIDPAQIEVGEELSYLRSGRDPRLLRRLRRGAYATQAELDLHQMNVAAARASIADFLAECGREGQTCVRIIHGKGLRSRDGPVLKALTDRLLRLRADVVAFASAPSAQGGTGAVLVLLQRR
ncbi:MAG: Smr/MutS family protein [Xanthomonadaceae bacterium]|nr:Smr/MutS family protein [Xanthomonadaceae bacterium]